MLPESWAATIRAFGLCVILMRSGLELDVTAIKRIGMVALRLTCMPGICEALAVSGAAMWIFGMPFPLALSCGFVLAAVSPAVVVVGMFNLQQRGFGVSKGIPSLVVAAASFDDVVAISGFSMCIGLAVGHGSLLMNALHGPINLVAGFVAGYVGGTIASFTEIWDKRWKRTLIILLQGVIFTFVAKQYHFAGAGALASLIMAVVAVQNWMNGTPSCGGMHLTKGAQEHYAHKVETDLARVWVLLAQPLLFGVIGSALDFRKLPSSTIPQAILVTCLGVCVRTPVAFFSTYGVGLNFKERLFIALSWIPKATVQAALASVPLDMVLDSMHEEDDNYAEYVKWGKDILTTAVFSIILTAPIGLIVIQKLGPLWLTNDGTEVGQAQQGTEVGQALDGYETHDAGKGHAEGQQQQQEQPKFNRAASIVPNQKVDAEGAGAFIDEQLQLMEALAGKLTNSHVKPETAALDLRKRVRRLEMGVGLLKKALSNAEQKVEESDMRVGDGEEEEKIVDTSSNFFRMLTNQNEAPQMSQEDWSRVQSV